MARNKEELFPVSLDDKNLIDRIVENNDHRAFEELMKRYQSQIRYSLRQLTGWDEALADDLAQETFIKAYRSLHQFRGDAKFFTWLYRIAYHCYAAYYRSHKPEQRLDETGIEEGSYNPQHDIDVHRDFAMALKNLSPEQRMALHLHMQREFSHQEVADIMVLPLGTVKSHILRGREKLKQQLSSWQRGE